MADPGFRADPVHPDPPDPPPGPDPPPKLPLSSRMGDARDRHDPWDTWDLSGRRRPPTAVEHRAHVGERISYLGIALTKYLAFKHVQGCTASLTEY